MTKEEYIQRMKEEEDWAPGWDAIDEEFSRLYPGVKPAHYGTNIEARAMFGGNCYLDGYSIYDTGKGYMHIVTYGMSELYADEESFGGEWDGWGYEMTMKLKADKPEDCLWALDMLSNIARYTYETKNFYSPYQVAPGNGTPIRIGSDSKLTALLSVPDTSAQPVDTVHGRLEFIQFCGITEPELDAIKADYDNITKLVQLMEADDPEFITDLSRTKSYL